MIYICNAFSLSMLDREAQRGTPGGYVPRSGDPVGVARVPRPIDDPRPFLADADRFGVPVLSAVGHADTAALFSALLGRPVPANRVTVKLAHQDVVLVGQLQGPRLPEGATTLPKGAWLI